MKIQYGWIGIVLAVALASVAQTNTFPSSGNVGIGTISPAGTLDVNGNVIIRSYGTTLTTTGTNGPVILFSNATTPTSGNWTLGVPGWANANQFFLYDRNNSTIPFLVEPGAGNDDLYVRAGGNVGIGTSTPGQKLEVNGSILLSSGSAGSITFADGTTQSTAWTGSLCGGDYAESVDVTGGRNHYGPGDVLRIDDDHRGAFLKEAEPYSTAVAGVFSTRPGALGRRQTTPKSPDEVPLAMIGIVPVKVTTENGPIRPHDLLVSSSRPGYAMKGTDRSRMLGAVIGKAMEPLDKGDGVIEVLLTLQ